MKKVSINIVLHDEERYMPFIVASLKNQTFKDFEAVIVDNNSKDRSAELMENSLREANIDYRIFRLGENTGFANAHNLAYQKSNAQYILIQNPDMWLMPDTIEKMVLFLDKHQATVSVAPRLMRWDFSRVTSVDHPENGFSDRVDAIGVRLFRNRRAIEMYSGATWSPESEDKNIKRIFSQNILEVFGVSGAMAMYRKEILDRVTLPGNNMFDPLYHSYKEDLDLAYRLRNAGMLSYVLLDTVAYHDRTSAGPADESDLAAIKNKKRQSYYVRFHSYKNHLATLYKNEYWQNMLLDWPFIFWFELRKFGYILLTQPSILWRSMSWLWVNCRQLRMERRGVHAARKMYWKGIRRWF